MHQHFDLTLCAPADTRTTLPLHARTHARTHMHTHTQSGGQESGAEERLRVVYLDRDLVILESLTHPDSPPWVLSLAAPES
jgi:hypothetical protein